MSETYYDPMHPEEEHGVLWKVHPTDDDPRPGWRLYGKWHGDIADALGELEAAAKNPRCADARLYTRLVRYVERTGNAVAGRKTT